MFDLFRALTRGALWTVVAASSVGAHADPISSHLPLVPADEIGLSSTKLQQIDAVAAQTVSPTLIPGAVIVAGRQGKLAFQKAYGLRALQDQPEPNSVDTIYDLASLTKPLATALAVMILADEGRIDIAAPLARYIPEAARGGKDAVTIEQLLRHRAGLPADNDMGDYVGPIDQVWDRLLATPITRKGAGAFEYSDVGFELLGKLVERVSGQSLDAFTHDHIYQPLGMTDTGFRPDASPCPRCAPTIKRAKGWARGVVHDPRSLALGGVAGHAGLFSTADDLAILAQMILNCGEYGGVRILSRARVREMVRAIPATDGQVRGLGWDIDSKYSSLRGKGFPVGSFGHTGYTGTSLWLDPSSGAFAIVLTNRVHPEDIHTTEIATLRRLVSEAVADSIVKAPLPSLDGVAGFCHD